MTEPTIPQPTMIQDHVFYKEPQPSSYASTNTMLTPEHECDYCHEHVARHLFMRDVIADIIAKAAGLK